MITGNEKNIEVKVEKEKDIEKPDDISKKAEYELE